jgi:hypothetical protein
MIVIPIIESSNIVYLENCTYSIDLYKEYLNLLSSSNDSRSLHIQAVYSLSSNNSLIPGHIYTYSTQSVALIPFFIQCPLFPFKSYLPFTQCSSTVTNLLIKKNYESTRTNLNIKSILSLNHVPLLYISQSNILLSNCSFQSNSILYQLKPNEIFSFHIEYESSISSTCHSCNRRTSICYDKTCRCRSGTIPWKLYQDKEYCIDITRNCSLDSQRCLYSKSILNNHLNQFLLLLIVLIIIFSILFFSIIWFVCRNVNINKKEMCSNQPIFIIDRHERTPSTISTTDSIQLNDNNQYIIRNEYPRIIGEKNNGEIVLILV